MENFNLLPTKREEKRESGKWKGKAFSISRIKKIGEWDSCLSLVGAWQMDTEKEKQTLNGSKNRDTNTVKANKKTSKIVDKVLAS